MTVVSSRNPNASTVLDSTHPDSAFPESLDAAHSAGPLLTQEKYRELLSSRDQPGFAQRLNHSIQHLLESSNRGAVALLRWKESLNALIHGHNPQAFFQNSQICAALAYGALKIGAQDWQQRLALIPRLGFFNALEVWQYDVHQDLALQQAQMLAREARPQDLAQFRPLMDALQISQAAAQSSLVASNYQGLTSSLLNQAGSLTSMLISTTLSQRGWSAKNLALSLAGGLAMGSIQAAGNFMRDAANVRPQEWQQAYPRLFWNAGRQIVESSICAGLSYGVGLGVNRLGLGNGFSSGLVNFFLSDGIGETSVSQALDEAEVALHLREEDALQGTFAGAVAANMVEEVGGDAHGHAIHAGIHVSAGMMILATHLVHPVPISPSSPAQESYSLQGLVDLILQAEVSKSNPDASKHVNIEDYIQEILAGGEPKNFKAAIERSGVQKLHIRIEEAIYQSPDPHRAIIELICNALDAYKIEGKIPDGLSPQVEVNLEDGKMQIIDAGKGMGASSLLRNLLAPMQSDKGNGEIGTFGIGFYTALRYLNSASDEVNVTSSTGTETHRIQFKKVKNEIRYSIEKLANIKQSGTIVEIKSDKIKAQSLEAHAREYLEDVAIGEIYINGQTINRALKDKATPIFPQIPIGISPPLLRGIGGIWKLVNEKYAGKIRVLVGGILIETFDSQNPNSPGFALDLPLGCNVNLTRNQVEVNAALYDAMERVINQSENLELLNVLALLCKTFDKRFADEERKRKEELREGEEESNAEVSETRVPLLSGLKQRVYHLLKEPKYAKQKVYPEDAELRRQIEEEDAVFLHPLLYEESYLRRFTKPNHFVSGRTKDQSGEQRELKLVLAPTKDVYHYDSERAVLYLDEKFYKSAKPYVLGALFMIPDLRFKVDWSMHPVDAALSMRVAATEVQVTEQEERNEKIKKEAQEIFEKFESLGLNFESPFASINDLLHELDSVGVFQDIQNIVLADIDGEGNVLYSHERRGDLLLNSKNLPPHVYKNRIEEPHFFENGSYYVPFKKKSKLLSNEELMSFYKKDDGMSSVEKTSRIAEHFGRKNYLYLSDGTQIGFNPKTEKIETYGNFLVIRDRSSSKTKIFTCINKEWIKTDLRTPLLYIKEVEGVLYFINEYGLYKVVCKELKLLGTIDRVLTFEEASLSELKSSDEVLVYLVLASRIQKRSSKFSLKESQKHFYLQNSSDAKDFIPIQLLVKLVSDSKFFARAEELKSKGHSLDENLTFILYASDELWNTLLADEYLADHFLPYLRHRSVRLFFERALQKKEKLNVQHFDHASRLIQLNNKLFISYAEREARAELEEDFFRKIEMVLKSGMDIDKLLEDLTYQRSSQDVTAINILMKTPRAQLVELREAQIQKPAISTQSLAQVLTHFILYSSENDARLIPVSEAANTPAAKPIQRALYHAIEPLYVGNPHAYVRELLQNSLDVLKFVRQRKPEEQNTKIEFQAYNTKDRYGRPQLTVSARDYGGVADLNTFKSMIVPGQSTKKKMIELLNQGGGNGIPAFAGMTKENAALFKELGGFGVGFYSLMKGANWVRVKTAVPGTNQLYVAHFEVERDAKGKVSDIRISYEELENHENFVGTLVETQRRCAIPELDITRLEAMVEEMGMYVDNEYAQVTFQGRVVNSKKVKRLACIEKHPKLGKVEVLDGLKPKLVLGQLTLCDLPEDVWKSVPKPIREYFNHLGFFVRLDPSVLKPTKTREELINHQEVMAELKKLLPALLMRAFLERVVDPDYKEDLHHLPEVYFVQSYGMAGSIKNPKIQEAARALIEHRYEDAKLSELVEGCNEQEAQKIYMELMTLVPLFVHPLHPDRLLSIENISELYQKSLRGDEEARVVIEAFLEDPNFPSELKLRLSYSEKIRSHTQREKENAGPRLRAVGLEEGKVYSLEQIQNADLKIFTQLLQNLATTLYQAHYPKVRVQLLLDTENFEGKAYAVRTADKNIFTLGYPYSSGFHAQMQEWNRLRQTERNEENKKAAECLLAEILETISHEVTHQALEYPNTIAHTHTVEFYDDQAKKSLAKGSALLPSVEELLGWK